MKKPIYLFVFFLFSIPLLLSAALNNNINAFASKFYTQALAFSDQNEVFSPYCLFSALSMVYLGSDGSTKEEMEQVLCLDFPQEDLPALLQNLTKSLKPKDDLVSLSIASSLWAGQNTYLLPSYEHVIGQGLQAKMDRLDFSDTVKSASCINTWIEEQTKGLLQNVVGQEDISPYTKLMLVSALYFKGSWQTPFLASNTKERPFYTDPSSSYLVPMMEQVSTFPYFENNDVQLFLLPFSKETACFFVLPKGSLEGLRAFPLLDWIGAAKSTKISVILPRFTVRPEYELTSILATLGMPSAFSSYANFSKINGQFDLCIDKAKHVALFSLNEEGVTAAAATSISMICKCVHVQEDPPISFVANRPFLFGIVDLKSNVMLFLGKVVKP